MSFEIRSVEMISFDEYKIKKQQINEHVLKLLADDSRDSTVYTLHMRNRETNLSLDCGVFRHYSTLKETMESRIEFEEIANDDNYCAGDFEWFDIKKYIMKDGEYEQEMTAKVAFDYRLIHYFKKDDLKDIKATLEQEVPAPYETGEIIKIKNMPLSEDYYAIYIYDEAQKGNKHIQMTYGDELECCKFHWLELTEKVENCTNDRINELSKEIKEMNGDFLKVFERHGYNMEIHPF